MKVGKKLFKKLQNRNCANHRVGTCEDQARGELSLSEIMRASSCDTILSSLINTKNGIEYRKDLELSGCLCELMCVRVDGLAMRWEVKLRTSPT
jgi:hypothetical protein